MITNGGSFVLSSSWSGPDAAYYALSRIFEMRNPGNDLYSVSGSAQTSKHLVLQEQPEVR